MRKLVVAAAGGLLLLTACSSSHRLSALGPNASVAAGRTDPPASSAPAAPAAPNRSAPDSSAALGSAGPRTSAPAARTQLFVVRPVTAQGTAAAGFTVRRMTGMSAQCGTSAADTEASRVAVEDNILFCYPDALTAPACWPDAQAGFTLCLADPSSRRLYEYPLAGPLPQVTRRPDPTPLAMTLADGSHCLFRVGGAWNGLDGHPNLDATYGCGSLAVWASSNSAGINRSAAQWSVQVAPIDGHGSLRTLAVTSAYFVGNAR